MSDSLDAVERGSWKAALDSIKIVSSKSDRLTDPVAASGVRLLVRWMHDTVLASPDADRAHRRRVGKEDAKSFSVLKQRLAWILAGDDGDALDCVVEDAGRWRLAIGRWLLATPSHLSLATMQMDYLRTPPIAEILAMCGIGDGAKVCERIKCVDLSSCNFTMVPHRLLEGCDNVIYLNISWNRLTSLPEEVGAWRNLTTIVAYENPLTSMPSKVTAWSKYVAANSSERAPASLFDYALYAAASSSNDAESEIPWPFHLRLSTLRICPCCYAPFSWSPDDPDVVPLRSPPTTPSCPSPRPARLCEWITRKNASVHTVATRRVGSGGKTTVGQHDLMIERVFCSVACLAMHLRDRRGRRTEGDEAVCRCRICRRAVVLIEAPKIKKSYETVTLKGETSHCALELHARPSSTRSLIAHLEGQRGTDGKLFEAMPSDAGSDTDDVVGGMRPSQSVDDVGGTPKSKKKKIRPLSNLFSTIASKQKEAAGQRRYNKLQKQAKNSPAGSPAPQRISEEDERPRKSMDFRLFGGKGDREREAGFASEPNLATTERSRSSVSTPGIKPPSPRESQQTSPTGGKTRPLSPLNTTDRGVSSAYADSLSPDSARLDAGPGLKVVRKKPSMASIFTVGDRTDRSSDDESGSSGSKPPLSAVGTDSDAEDALNAAIKEKFSELQKAEDQQDPPPHEKPISPRIQIDYDGVATTPIANMDIKLPPRPTSPGVDDLEPDPDAPIKSAPSSLRSPSPNSAVSDDADTEARPPRTLNHKTTHEILISLPPRPSSPGVEDLDSPSTFQPRSTSPDAHLRASPEPSLVATDTLRNKPRALSTAGSMLSLASNASNGSGSSPSSAITAEQAAALAAAEAAHKEKLASLARRSELSVAARLSGVVSRHVYIHDAKKPTTQGSVASIGSTTSSVAGGAAKFFGSLFSSDAARPASPSSLHSSTSNGSLPRVPSLTRERSHQPTASSPAMPTVERSYSVAGGSSKGIVPATSIWATLTDSPTTTPATVGKSKLDELMGMLMVEADDAVAAARKLEREPEPDEDDLAAAEEVKRIREAFEAEERLQALVGAVSMKDIAALEAEPASSTTTLPDVPGTPADDMSEAAPAVDEDPVARAAREASQAAAAVAAGSSVAGKAGGMGGGVGGFQADSIEAMLSKLETVYAAVAINQTAAGAGGAEKKDPIPAVATSVNTA
ncbi:hypothetical protein HDU96_004327 [Phlyctochytrium bullatum]|nr:hypothetical protein HDU96_004327 [Phlyctochytrium bullatum]